jgi:uncharacterized protein (TIGR02284 family)
LKGFNPQEMKMPGTDHDIHVLNSLIKTTLDSRKGFQDAAEDAESTHFASFFSDFAQRRAEAAAVMQEEVRALGGNPEDDSSFLGAAHRTFLSLKEMFVSRDDKAIVDEVERGEDYIKEKFQEALADNDLGDAARAAIMRANESVQAGHARASELKHSLAM